MPAPKTANDLKSESQPVLLQRRAVQSAFGNVSAMWIERRLADDPKFPKPIYIGRIRFWQLNEIEKYIEERASAPKPKKNPNLNRGVAR